MIKFLKKKYLQFITQIKKCRQEKTILKKKLVMFKDKSEEHKRKWYDWLRGK